jgi:hypothetical protein
MAARPRTLAECVDPLLMSVLEPQFRQMLQLGFGPGATPQAAHEFMCKYVSPEGDLIVPVRCVPHKIIIESFAAFFGARIRKVHPVGLSDLSRDPTTLQEPFRSMARQVLAPGSSRQRS